VLANLSVYGMWQAAVPDSVPAEAIISRAAVSPTSDERYNKRLAIIVPYRDRAAHLQDFLPHIITYFARDKLDRHISVSVHIIEQVAGAPFNRGMIKNCGYRLVRDKVDYVCFHDVDYLPVWADYSWSVQPCRLIWHGLTLNEDWEQFFGGVVLFDKAAFERVNGYSNAYWGWGPEDLELRARCNIAGLNIDHRDGTYQSLAHVHAGFSAPGIYTEEARRTLTIWDGRTKRLKEVMTTDGLSSCDFKLVQSRRVSVNGNKNPPIVHYLVDIGDEMKATATDLTDRYRQPLTAEVRDPRKLS
jgi:hypothetical protein